MYGDYQAPKGELHGPEKGSVREDQGSVAFYYVEDFVVRGCRFSRSRSDGTHFYHCTNGHFSDNRVDRSKMGVTSSKVASMFWRRIVLFATTARAA
ncbi:MAG: hypothetical protein R3C02_04705 [Planctomycetaceae bacterium]